jgi:hypothetical protein
LGLLYFGSSFKRAATLVAFGCVMFLTSFINLYAVQVFHSETHGPCHEWPLWTAFIIALVPVLVLSLAHSMLAAAQLTPLIDFATGFAVCAHGCLVVHVALEQFTAYEMLEREQRFPLHLFLISSTDSSLRSASDEHRAHVCFGWVRSRHRPLRLGRASYDGATAGVCARCTTTTARAHSNRRTCPHQLPRQTALAHTRSELDACLCSIWFYALFMVAWAAGASWQLWQQRQSRSATKKKLTEASPLVASTGATSGAMSKG